MLDHSLEAWAFLAASGIGLMAAIAMSVIDFSAGGLLRIEAEFGVGLAALDVTRGEHCEHHDSQHSKQKSGAKILQKPQQTFSFQLHPPSSKSRRTRRCEPSYNDRAKRRFPDSWLRSNEFMNRRQAGTGCVYSLTGCGLED